MIAVDSSVAIAALATWHHLHVAAIEVLGDGPRLPAHAALETYSVLTRLPGDHRADAEQVRAAMEDAFPGPPLILSGARTRNLIRDLAAAGITGGACYDAVIAATAAAAGARLVSADRRAASTYERMGVEVSLL